MLLKWTKNFLLLIFGFCFALGLVEWGLRLAGVRPATYLRKFSRYHSTLGWEKVPGAEGHFRRGDVLVHEKINSLGLRGPEYAHEKPEGTFRILVLGDSFTEGYDVELDDLFTTILERSLRKRWPKIEVINGGTGGYSTDQMYLFLRVEGYKYHPDLVVMMTYPTNDVYYNIKNRYGNYYKPLFELADSTLMLTNTPLPMPPLREGIKDVFREFALYQFILTDVLPRNPWLGDFLERTGWISPATLELASGQRSAPSSFRIYERSQDPETERAWAITTALLSATQVLCDSLGSRFVVFSIPDQFQLYDAAWSSTQERYGVDERMWDRTKPERMLSQYCTDHRISFINLLDTLKADGTPSNLYAGVHWNADGNRLTARVLEHWVNANYPGRR